MSFPRYPKYKDSGVEWLGQVPEYWEVLKGRRLFTQERDPSQPTDQQLSATQKYGVVPQKLFMEMEDQKVTLALSGLENFKQVQEGDFVISLRSFQGGIERSAYSGCVSPAYTVLRPSDSVHGLFWGYLLKSKGYIEALQTMTDGIRDGKNISYQQFGIIGVPVAPITEQANIAVFLDQETAKIDALVAEQQRLMELLKVKRQAVISHAVTKGLNPKAALKPSGIEWLGDVPEHWKVVPFRSAIKFQEGPGIMAADFHDVGIPLLRVSGVQDRWATLDGCNYLDPKKVAVRWEHFRVRIGDLLISASASMGTVCEVGAEVEGAVPYTGLIRLTPNGDTISRDYIRAVVVSSLFTTQIDLLKAGATIQHFGPTHLSQMKIVLPPPAEQEQITSHINKQNDSFDTLTAEAQRAIDLLQERRTALISAAVTGQIDVRSITN